MVVLNPCTLDLGIILWGRMKNLETPKNVPEAGPDILVRTTLCFLHCMLSTCPRQVSMQPPYCVFVPENRGPFQKKRRTSLYTSGAGRNREARHLNGWQGADSGPRPCCPTAVRVTCPQRVWLARSQGGSWSVSVNQKTWVSTELTIN